MLYKENGFPAKSYFPFSPYQYKVLNVTSDGPKYKIEFSVVLPFILAYRLKGIV